MNDDKNRQSLLLPVLIPVVAIVAIGVVLFGFSRVLLQITPTAAWVTALIAAAGIMSVATYVASRRSVSGGSIFSMVGAVAGITMLTGGVALFAASKGEEGGGLPIVLIVAPVGASTTGFAEETRAVTAPAGEPFQIEFDNMDTTAHNVVITASEDPGAEPLFRQPPVPGGPEPVFWEVDPIAEGLYFFHCEVHPTTMTGKLEAVQPTTVVAQNQVFDTDEITLAADTATSIVFVNSDAGIQHNLAIYRDAEYTQPIVEDPPTSGPDERSIKVPPLEAGTYYFRCDIHPATMIGKVVVEPAGGSGEKPAESTGGG